MKQGMMFQRYKHIYINIGRGNKEWCVKSANIFIFMQRKQTKHEGARKEE